MKNSTYCLLLLLFLTACKKDENTAADQQVIVISAAGNINSRLNEFRHLLGDVLNTTPGNVTGKREINWDAVPDSFASRTLPHDFFNITSAGAPPQQQRGLVYSFDADARISNNGFAGMEISNAGQFPAFSGTKTFSTVNSNLWNVEFEVAGQPVAASVKGFGAVFIDVDKENITTMEYFSGAKSLGVYTVPKSNSGTPSFLGVYFPGEKVTRVTIRQGEKEIAPGRKDITAGGDADLVIMDDFLYDEPTVLQ